MLLYLNTRSLAKVIIVLLAVPFSLVGAFLLLYLLGYHLSVAVWVGIIALAGVDAETGVVMLLYLDVAYERWSEKAGRMNSIEDLEGAVLEGAVQRVRPKMMTVMAILMGLLPIMWSTGTGADVMKRIAAPMVGGIITSFHPGTADLSGDLHDLEVVGRGAAGSRPDARSAKPLRGGYDEAMELGRIGTRDAVGRGGDGRRGPRNPDRIRPRSRARLTSPR